MYGNYSTETMWNNLIPKINIYVIPVRVELDKKGIQLHTILCPWCDEVCESVDHSLILCKEVIVS